MEVLAHKRGTASPQKNMFNQPVDSARELLVRYGSGERVFKGASLNGVNLQGACLGRISLIEANLVQANLSHADLHESHLERSNLTMVRTVFDPKTGYVDKKLPLRLGCRY